MDDEVDKLLYRLIAGTTDERLDAIRSLAQNGDKLMLRHLKPRLAEVSPTMKREAKWPTTMKTVNRTNLPRRKESQGSIPHAFLCCGR